MLTGCIGIWVEYLEYESHALGGDPHHPQTDRQQNNVAEAAEVIAGHSRLHSTVEERAHVPPPWAADHAAYLHTLGYVGAETLASTHDE